MPNDVKEDCRAMLEDRPDAELRQLAMDIMEGRVLCDWQVVQPMQVELIFLPLALMDAKTGKKLAARKPGMIYERISRACRMGVNGYPIFGSFHILSQPDAVKVQGHIEAIKQQRKKFLEEK